MGLSSGLGISIRLPRPAGLMQYNGSSMKTNQLSDAHLPHIIENQSYEKEFA
jgi:hypothetical protein